MPLLAFVSLSKYRKRQKELANSNVISRWSGNDIEKKIVYIGSARNKIISFKHKL